MVHKKELKKNFHGHPIPYCKYGLEKSATVPEQLSYGNTRSHAKKNELTIFIRCLRMFTKQSKLEGKGPSFRRRHSRLYDQPDNSLCAYAGNGNLRSNLNS